MQKKLFSLLLVAVISVSCANISALAEEAAKTQSKIFINGEQADINGYNVKDNNYFKLRDLGRLLDFGVEWDKMTNSIYIDTSKGYTENDISEWTAKQYSVAVPQKYKVPFSYSKTGYFENGLTPGYGSAVTFKGYNANGEMEFYAISDRGPNADAPQYKIGGNISDAKIFPCPDFTLGIAVITLKGNEAVVTSAIELKDMKGKNITGLPLKPGLVGATNEAALDMNLNNIGYDDNGLDTEGIAVDKDGNFWVCDEYGPFIAKFAPDGTQLAKYAPASGLDEVLKYRIPNRGFEGITITPSGKILASMQSVLDVNGETSKTACFTRIVELDPKTGKTKTYAYPVDVSAYNSPKDCKIGDIYAIDDNTVLVIEQGKLADKTMRNIIYKVDLTNATDITDVKYNGQHLEYAKSAEELNISFAQKEKMIDLRAMGWTAEKAEGLCMTDENTIAVINDNDFGITTKVIDKDNDTAITNYIYDSNIKAYELNGKRADPTITIDKNTESAQLWLFKKNM